LGSRNHRRRPAYNAGQPDMRVFKVFDNDGRSIALFYRDYFKRDNKNGVCI
jgi:Zn-dependent oligopeptidase